MAKNTICVWYDKDAEAAARFYVETFPDSAVGAIHRAPGDYPSGKKGDVLIVEFKVAGVSCIGLNGGPAFKHSEAFSFQIATDDQAETDRYRSEEYTSELQSRLHLVCRLLLEKKKNKDTQSLNDAQTRGTECSRVSRAC